jgi:hypothetical protein
MDMHNQSAMSTLLLLPSCCKVLLPEPWQPLVLVEASAARRDLSVRFIATSVLTVVIVCMFSPLLRAQSDVIRPFLRKMDYYKYSAISFFEADAAAQKRFREKYTPTLQKTAAVEQAEQDCPNTDEIKKKLKNRQPVPQSLIDDAPNECEIVRNYYKTLSETVQIGKVFIVTEKYQDGTEPVIIGAVAINALPTAQAADPEAIKNALNSPKEVLDANELRSFKTQETEQSTDPNNPGEVHINGSIENTTYTNMYDYLKALIKQNPQDKVSQIRPTQTVAMKINKEVVTKMLSEDNVADYLYITDGEPHKARNLDNEKTFTDEITIGLADYFSWRHYESAEEIQGEPTGLPKYGIEMRAGLEDLGYPSLWSERWTVNALWGAQKLGVVLPTSLWSDRVTPIFTTRRMTYGLPGINASFDFPFKLIERSGVFNLSGSYLFGSDNVVRTERLVGYDTMRVQPITDYFIRGHFQGNYTFAIGINDPDREEQVYYIRFKLGAAGYLVQSASTTLSRNEGPATYTSGDLGRQQFFADFLARIEYMATGLSAPWGAYVQYFGGALSGQAWLQVPISDTGFLTAIRLDGKIFAPVTRAPHPWEVSQVVIMPSVRFVFRW